MVPRAVMHSTPTLGQFRGCLLGLALGDALGAAVEAFPPAVAATWADSLQEGAVPGTGPGGWSFGQVTDDTQLTRELLQSIADESGFAPEVFAARLVSLVESGRLVGGGPATFGAAKQLASGVPWHESGMPSPYAGNGAAMRAGPLGLLFRHDPRQLTRIAVDQARVTHHDSRAIAGAAAIAWAVAIASRPEPIVARGYLEEIAAEVDQIDPGFARALGQMAAWVPLPPSEAAAYLAASGLEPEMRAGWQGVSSYVVSSVCWSLYAFLQHPESWWDAVRVAIGVGGDTDTLAAMTGSITGARLGATVLPGPLLSRLLDRDERLLDPLSQLASRLPAVARRDEPGDDR